MSREVDTPRFAPEPAVGVQAAQFALRSDNSLSLHLQGFDGPAIVLQPEATRALFRFLDQLNRRSAAEAL